MSGLLLAFSPCSGVDHLVGAPCFEIGLDLHSVPSGIRVDSIDDVAVIRDTCANDKAPALWRRIKNYSSGAPSDLATSALSVWEFEQQGKR